MNPKSQLDAFSTIKRVLPGQLRHPNSVLLLVFGNTDLTVTYLFKIRNDDTTIDTDNWHLQVLDCYKRFLSWVLAHVPPSTTVLVSSVLMCLPADEYLAEVAYKYFGRFHDGPEVSQTVLSEMLVSDPRRLSLASRVNMVDAFNTGLERYIHELSDSRIRCVSINEDIVNPLTGNAAPLYRDQVDPTNIHPLCAF